jgi:hypothetical protein
MSTELSQLGLDGEQQLGINPGSPNEGQQMGINPCPYTKKDDKWESTHVHQAHLIRSMQPQNSGQKMGQDLQNPLMLGSHNHKRIWPQHGRQQVGINPRLLGSPN